MTPSNATIEIGDSYLPLLDPAREERFIFFEGPRGTGKTRAILTCLMTYALANPGARILLCRSTRTRLSETVLTTLEEQVFPAFGMKVPGNATRQHRDSYPVGDGSMFIPMGLDDPQRSTSLEVAKIYCAEVIEIPLRIQIEALAGALRQPGMPQKACYLDANPGPPGHWVNHAAEPIDPSWRRVNCMADYQRLLDHANRPAPPGKWKRIVTRHQDNPGYFNAREWSWTPDGADYLKTLDVFTGHLRRRWLDGDWVAAEGTVYPEFDDQRHTVDPFNIPSDWPWWMGWDPGYDHPTAILWFTVSPNGTIYIADEIYRGGAAVSEHCASIHARNAGRTIRQVYGDPQHAFSRTAQSPKTIAAQARECGVKMSPWPRTSGNEETMVERVRELLRRDKLKVFRTCQATIGEFQSWSYARKASGERTDGEDKFEDKENDTMDVVKGVVATGALKPKPGRMTVN